MAERQLNEPTFRDRNGNTKTNIYHHYSNLTGVDGEKPEELNNQDLNNQKNTASRTGTGITTASITDRLKKTIPDQGQYFEHESFHNKQD